ncbi:MAG TPA: pitrilysin family protein [Longimicrobiales bacterium]|nr:pitrilysin family protein [Longimicrobiales bacterium]
MGITLPCERFILDNGLRVILHEDPRAPLVAVNLWYHVGSKDEVPGRTGFAHLFEHLMFEGSANVPAGSFDALLEEAGATNNGSTAADRTNYWELLPAHALDLALWLEADRMGGLMPAITPERLDAQRDVVMNERRQQYENRPYGLVSETLLAALYADGHPYRSPVIGSMADLAAANLDDVRHFCTTYYSPGNASLVVAGDIDAGRVRAAVERYFGGVAAGPPVPPVSAAPASLDADRRIVMEDDVSLPRLYMTWHSPPYLAAGDAELDIAADVLAHGRASRLFRSLVYERQVGLSVAACQDGALLGSTFDITITGRPDTRLADLEAAVRDAIHDIAGNGISDRELERARNGIETAVIDSLQSVGGFGGRADRLNMYQFYAGSPDCVGADLARYDDATAEAVGKVVHDWLLAPAVVLGVVPRGRTDLADGHPR